LRIGSTLILCVPAGQAVDDVLARLVDVKHSGFTVLDTGNSFFEDSVRRHHYLKPYGIKFIDVGISGGVAIKDNGASLMIGASVLDTKDIKGILEAVSFRSGTYRRAYKHLVGVGAGHFVKMVHNGIEYAWLQLWCEYVYYQLNINGMTPLECGEYIENMEGEFCSGFIKDITTTILREQLREGDVLLDHISETCDANGTGAQSVTTALRFGVPCSMIAAAVEARNLGSSREKAIRSLRDNSIDSQFQRQNDADFFEFSNLALAVALSQGLMIVSAVSDQHDWNLDLKEVLDVWNNGSIIRGGMLQFALDKEIVDQTRLCDLYLDFLAGIPQLRSIVRIAVNYGYPMPCHTAALTFLDSISLKNIWTPLLSAQRDYFGGHGFRMRGSPKIQRWNWSKC